MSTNYPASLDDDAKLHQLVNDLNTTTSSAYTSPATTLDLTDASAFPSTGGVIYVNNERGTYTGKTANQLTGISGLGNNHNAGVVVEQNIDAEHHNNLKDAVIALETKVGVTSSAVAGTVIKRIADLEAFDSGSLVDSDIGVIVQGYDADTSKLDVAETRSASLNIADNELIRPKTKDVSGTVTDHGTISTTQTITLDHSASNEHKLTVSGTPTITLRTSNWPATGADGYINLEIINGGLATIVYEMESGNNAPVWLTPGAAVPTLDSAGTDFIGMFSKDSGTVVYAGQIGAV